MDTKGEDTKDDEEGGDEGRVSPILITVCKVLAKVIGKERWSTTWFHFPHSQNCHTLPPANIVCVVSVSLFVDEEYTNQPEQDMHPIEKALVSYKNS